MTKKSSKIPAWKKEEVKDVIRLIKAFPVFGVVDLENLPALQLQRMRLKLKDSITLKMTKKRLIKIALYQLKDQMLNLDQISQAMRGMPALIFTKENPFKLYKLLAANKSKAPAKPGQTAQSDIIIHAGPTQFTPGPIISELAQAGIKTKVEEGKLSVVSDVTLVKEGEKISPKKADLLSRFGLEPMEVGINLVAAYENGITYQKDVLSIDEQAYINNIAQASRDSIALSMEIGYITKDIIEIMIQKAYRDSRALAESTDIMTSEKAERMLAQANLEMENIKKTANIPEEAEQPKEAEKPKEEVKEEKKEEPKKEKKEEKVKYFKEKGPSAKEVLEQVEAEEKKEEEEKKKKEEEKKKAEEMKKVEELAQNIMSGKKS